MNSILITGCNKGLGLGIVKALIKKPNPPKMLIATCRDIGKAEVSRYTFSQLSQNPAGVAKLTGGFFVNEEKLTYRSHFL